ncbi:MAG: hypothetical protein HQ483_08405 [Rhodospirillales bacterium]|nr:hypothetical protein [Rhodospirillales bacterium]
MTTAVSQKYNLVSAAFAFVLWGAWASAVNGENGLSGRIFAGLSQGAASFIITLLMVRLLVFVNGKISFLAASETVSSIFTVLITGSFLTLVHLTAHTPNIGLTIFPAITVAFLYCLYTAHTRLRQDASKKLRGRI